MKIIGTTRSQHFLVEMHRDEIANLLGHYYHRTTGCPDFGVGTTLDIGKLYNKLTSRQGMRKQMDAAQDLLRKLADLMDDVKFVGDGMDNIDKETKP